MEQPIKLLAIFCLFSLVPLRAQSPSNTSAILERLDRLQRENEEMAREIQELRAELSTRARPTDAFGGGAETHFGRAGGNSGRAH